MISVYNRQKDLMISKSSTRALVDATLKYLKISSNQVSVYFVTKKKIAALHRDFFNDPSPTDCISFPLDEDHLGEIFVCPETALDYAKNHGLDPYDETALYVIHGLLHLAGFDDIEEKDRRTMRKKEKSCMDYLNSLNINLKPK